MDGDFDELKILKRRGYFGPVFPVLSVIRGADAQSSANFSTPFFIADRNYEILEITERHETAATDGSLNVRKVPSGTAPASGTSVLSTTANLTSAANTNQDLSLTSVLADRRIATDEALTLEATGLLTSLVGVTVAVYLKAI